MCAAGGGAFAWGSEVVLCWVLGPGSETRARRPPSACNPSGTLFSHPHTWVQEFLEDNDIDGEVEYSVSGGGGPRGCVSVGALGGPP